MGFETWRMKNSTDPRCTSIFYGLQRGDENMSKSPSDSIIVVLAI